jgi:hypothetical protein
MLFTAALASDAGVLSMRASASGTPLPQRTPGSPAGRWLALFTPTGVRYTETGSLYRRKR